MIVIDISSRDAAREALAPIGETLFGAQGHAGRVTTLPVVTHRNIS